MAAQMGNVDSPRQILRPESKSFNWQTCDESQKEAIHKLILFLANAVRELDSVRAIGVDDFKIHSFYADTEVSRTCLLSGDRGTGKTSVLKTLFRLTRDKEFETRFFEGLDPHSATDRKILDINSSTPILSGRLRWLDPIDMEVLPGPSNLLASILCRIEEQVVEDLDGEDAKLTRGVSRYETALQDLRELMQDVTLAWDGNMPERGEHLDPDTYASEVIRAERARISIPDRVAKVLDGFSKRSKGALYVLPIDDFDLSPTRCLELLRLIRMLNVPRLFTVVLGSYVLTNEILQVKMTGDFAGVAKIRLQAKDLSDRIHSKHRKSATDALRKLIPFGQRIHLRHMTKMEALSFSPQTSQHNSGRKPQTLLQLLTGFELYVKRSVFGRKNLCLADLLFGSSEPDPYLLTTSAGILMAPPREISDLWFQLESLVTSQPTNGEVVDLASNLFEESIGFKLGEWEKIHRFNGIITHYPEEHGKAWVVNGALANVKLVDYQTRSLDIIEVRTGGEWEVQSASDPNDRIPLESLSHFVFLHDLAISYQSIEVNSSSVVPKSATIGTISSRLENRISLNWPFPQFDTFIELDCFVERWRQTVEQYDDMFIPGTEDLNKLSVIFSLWLLHLAVDDKPKDVQDLEASKIKEIFHSSQNRHEIAVDTLSTAFSRSGFNLNSILPLAPEYRLPIASHIASMLCNEEICNAVLESQVQLREARCTTLALLHKQYSNSDLLEVVYPYVFNNELTVETLSYLHDALVMSEFFFKALPDAITVELETFSTGSAKGDMTGFTDRIVAALPTKMPRFNGTKEIEAASLVKLLQYLKALRLARSFIWKRSNEAIHMATRTMRNRHGKRLNVPTTKKVLHVLDITRSDLSDFGVPARELEIQNILKTLVR